MQLNQLYGCLECSASFPKRFILSKFLRMHTDISVRFGLYISRNNSTPHPSRNTAACWYCVVAFCTRDSKSLETLGLWTWKINKGNVSSMRVYRQRISGANALSECVQATKLKFTNYSLANWTSKKLANAHTTNPSNLKHVALIPVYRTISFVFLRALSVFLPSNPDLGRFQLKIQRNKTEHYVSHHCIS